MRVMAAPSQYLYDFGEDAVLIRGRDMGRCPCSVKGSR